MTNQSDEIYALNGKSLKKIPSRNMRQGFQGKSLEDALQTLLEKYPEIIPGVQIDPSSEEPPRFALLRREIPVAGWSLDHLYVDQFGVLTLVETKLLQNPESRRDVIGQIVEYAANARDAWGSGLARQYAAEFWSKKGRELDDVIQERFPDLDHVDLWRSVENNLRQGHIRLMIAADTLQPEVRRMIEYLNNEMQNVEVLGLELRMYGEDEERLIFVPRIIGQTQAIVDRKSSRTGEKSWSPDMLRTAFNEFEPDERNYLLRMLEWSLENDCFVVSRAMNPCFGLEEKSGDRFISFYIHHEPYLWFDETRYLGGEERRNQIFEAFAKLGFYDPDLDPDEIVSGKTADRFLWDLSENEFQRLQNILSEYVK